VITGLGLTGCKDVYVGNQMIRGVSGGQKRRVTVGEILSTIRPVMVMDSISNGLDSATTFDIVRAIRQINGLVNNTVVVSLLQVSSALPKI
jgi:ABC-type multidrug transport system ATPase subunit